MRGQKRKKIIKKELMRFDVKKNVFKKDNGNNLQVVTVDRSNKMKNCRFSLFTSYRRMSK